MLKELLEYLAKNLVDNPDAVSVEAIEDGETTTLMLKVAQSDVGRVIGRGGRPTERCGPCFMRSGPNLGDGRDWRLLSSDKKGGKLFC